LIDLILVDDHALVRVSLCLALSTARDIRIVATANDGETALEITAQVPAQVLLLDLSLPGISGVELIRKILQQTPELAILMLSMESNPEIANQMITAGAAGFISKGAKLDILIEGIRTVASGGFFVDPIIEPHLA
jgi:DNA-binding NarL/FixJ family response regulator